MNNLLEIKNLNVEFTVDDGTLTAVKDVSLSIKKGETLGIVGESGCGKSVTSLAITRLVPQPPGKISSGSIVFDGVDLLALPVKEMPSYRGKRIGMIFQEPMTALSPLHKVGKQLVEAVQLHFDMSKQEAEKLSEEWLTKVGIPDASLRMKSYPYELSGGMRQRVMIAMTLMLEPELIIADEPTTALDVTIQAQILDLMKDMRHDSTAMILITHDMGVVWEMCDRVVVMYASEVVEEGERDDVFKAPKHPYTRGLLQSMPGVVGKAERLPSIPGRVPSLFNLPKGCNFAERCPYAKGICRDEKPELEVLADNCRVACHFYKELPEFKWSE